ncbi:LLM class flavin-dependent oxidoreductase [Microlunatus speluncae]|uniref:LLM class flavin-dependent oxidoreductase n=1 Tax=Microlunatus speluncae TaxID=2594267 RepID=UPI00126669F8|nr:TIGR03619 family F420-dependent LLM class oxidoreductase [Microlunatus speluncae]
MKLGLALPTAGELAGAEAIAKAAEGAEQLGLDSVWTFERLLAPTGPVSMGGQEIALPEAYGNVYSPLEVLAYVAARTNRVRLGTSVVVGPLHNPADLARRFATLDQLSNGRVVVGLGQGWMQQEYDAAGVPRSRLGAGFGELIEAMRAAWRPDPVSFEGRHYRYAESRISPKPVRPDGPPILVAAGAPASIRRTAAAGLGLNPGWHGWDALTAGIDGFHQAARDAGRDPATLPIVLRVNGRITEQAQGTEPTVIGSPDQIAEALAKLEGLGVTEVFWSMDLPIDEQLELIGRLIP